ncbi:MAG: WD40 repeat domain-containing protein [Chloroflexota bacterium]
MTRHEKQKHKPKSATTHRLPIFKIFTTTLVSLILLSTFQFVSDWLKQSNSDILTAYGNGQFRVIQTASTYMIWSDNHEYVSVQNDGTYRISDGVRLSDVNGYFSNTEQYIFRQNDGIYRLPDFERIVDAPAEMISIADGEHRFATGEIRFSPNDEYVAITGAGPYREEATTQSAEDYGIYRLSDGQQVIASDSLNMVFSSDSNYAIVQEGVYRLSDGSRLFEEGYTFSPDSQFIYARDGVYRLSNGERVLAVVSDVENSSYAIQHATFSPNSDYVLFSSDGLYRLSDGLRMDTLAYNPVYTQPPYFIADGEYLVIPSDDGLNVCNTTTRLIHTATSEELFEWDWCSDYAISSNHDLIAIGSDGIYRVSTQEKLLDVVSSRIYNPFSPSSDYARISDDGIYRLSDGAKLFDLTDIDDYDVRFNPNEEYITINRDGVYHLESQEKLFTIGGYNSYFSIDENYVITYESFGSEPTIYRLSDGESFENVDIIDPENGILIVGDAILVIDQTQQTDRMLFARSDYNNTIEARVLDETSEQYLINVSGELEWIDKTRVTTFHTP